MYAHSSFISTLLFFFFMLLNTKLYCRWTESSFYWHYIYTQQNLNSKELHQVNNDVCSSWDITLLSASKEKYIYIFGFLVLSNLIGKLEKLYLRVHIFSPVYEIALKCLHKMANNSELLLVSMTTFLWNSSRIEILWSCHWVH